MLKLFFSLLFALAVVVTFMPESEEEQHKSQVCISAQDHWVYTKRQYAASTNKSDAAEVVITAFNQMQESCH